MRPSAGGATILPTSTYPTRRERPAGPVAATEQKEKAMTASSAVTPRQVRLSFGERGTDRVHDRVHLERFVQRVQRDLAGRSANELAAMRARPIGMRPI